MDDKKEHKGIENLKPIKKGEVRNPNGRPKGAFGRKTIYKRWLEMQGSAEGITKMDDIALAMIEKALGGDVTAAAHVENNAFGKLTDKIEQDTKVTVTDVTSKVLEHVPQEELEAILAQQVDDND